MGQTSPSQCLRFRPMPVIRRRSVRFASDPQESETCTGGICFSEGRGKPLLDLAEHEMVGH
jgi:hypothetical protein